MDEEKNNAIAVIWNYMLLGHKMKKADVNFDDAREKVSCKKQSIIISDKMNKELKKLYEWLCFNRLIEHIKN